MSRFSETAADNFMIVTPYREDPFLKIRTFDEFFAAIKHALQEQLGERLDASTWASVQRSAEAHGTHPIDGSWESAIAHRAQIVSLTVPLYEIDPLLVLDAIAEANQDYFYWENGRQREAIAAVGRVVGLHVSGPDRMLKAKRFVRQCCKQTLILGDVGCPFAGARFFCRFTFFDQIASSNRHDLASITTHSVSHDAEYLWSSMVPDSDLSSSNSPDAADGRASLTQDQRSVDQTPAFASASVILPQWQVASRGQLGSFVTNLRLAPNTDLRAACAPIWQMLRQVRALSQRHLSWEKAGRSYSHWRSSSSHGKDERSPHSQALDPTLLHSTDFDQQPPTPIPQISHLERSQVEASVQGLLEAIEAKALSKAVLAHKLDVTLPKGLHIPTVLQTLRQVHADCYLFATQNQQGQTFLGASPERLLSIRQGQLTTEAIAGSAPRGNTPSEDARLAQGLLSSLKEQHEHQLVVDFISQQLEALGLKTQRSPFPCLLQLSNIQHLQTPIYAHLSNKLHALDLVAALHPTPAVAGVPRQQACEYIRRYELFERSLYAAPFGWIDHQGDSEFLVGIRSAQLDGTQARLYAGAGVVRGSNPKQELAEIELKLQALFSTLIRPNL